MIRIIMLFAFLTVATAVLGLSIMFYQDRKNAREHERQLAEDERTERIMGLVDDDENQR